MNLYDIYTLCSAPILFIIAAFFSLFSVIYISHCLNPKTRKEDFELFSLFKNSKIIISIVSIFSIIIMLFSDSYVVWKLAGSEDLRLAPDGVYCYYVIASPEDYAKTYTLPAKIKKTDGNYVVQNVYFSNGGYLYLNSGEYIDFNDSVDYCDQNGDIWEIELTNNKASHSKVHEYNEKYILNPILHAICVLSIFISCAVYIFKPKHQK